MLKRPFIPKLDPDVRRLMDETGTRHIEYVSLIVVFFEAFSLALFMLTRKNFGKEEWVSFSSVLFCIISSFIVFLSTDIF